MCFLQNILLIAMCLQCVDGIQRFVIFRSFVKSQKNQQLDCRSSTLEPNISRCSSTNAFDNTVETMSAFSLFAPSAQSSDRVRVDIGVVRRHLRDESRRSAAHRGGGRRAASVDQRSAQGRSHALAGAHSRWGCVDDRMMTMKTPQKHVQKKRTTTPVESLKSNQI